VRGEFIDVGGARLYYYAGGSRGAGAPLLLVHGFPTSSLLWSRTVPLVPPGYRVVVPDLLGFGRSDPPQFGRPGSDLSVAGHARRLIRLLDVLGIERVAAAGHGIGARIVLEMCAMDSRRIGRLALVNPVTGLSGGGGQSPVLRTVLPLLRALPSRVLLATVRRRVARLYADAAAHAPALDRYLRPFRGPGGATIVLAHLRALTIAEGIEADGAELSRLASASSRPVAIVCGRADPLVPPSAGEQLGARLPGSSLFEVAGGHFSPEESPEQVAAALGALLTAEASA
jgi:pimeloyl-ACP methyl ester carboxylesterase